ncbi:hypothetical protein [uncultured Bradyrhizobium sp.]|jgi:SAM-dependent methyltransferase|uniref:hypothetical protein n=1 Tax=uncultured Bradyrhizobium sp. TaxID=199684 RepID=UPI0034435FE7
MQVLDLVTSSYAEPILDAPCGFGRNALALAFRGYDVIAVDNDVARLKSLEASNALQATQSGRITTVRAKTTLNCQSQGKFLKHSKILTCSSAKKDRLGLLLGEGLWSRRLRKNGCEDPIFKIGDKFAAAKHSL